MMVRVEPDDRQLHGPLGRLSPLTKLAIALGWLVGLTTTTALAPPLALAAVAVAAGLTLGRIPIRALIRGAAPLWLAAFGVGLFNTMFAAANVDPAAAELARIGPLRLTEAALAGGIGLAARIVAIAVVGVVFAQTTDSTRLVDALVQHARVPDRFAYGALAAYQAVPRLSLDLTGLREARRLRGLRSSVHPRLLVGLLVLAIRHGDRMALAMDARGFGSGPRTAFRTVRWAPADAVALVIAAAGLAGALRLA
jgi:energy-coupling factor transport system permease protein